MEEKFKKLKEYLQTFNRQGVSLAFSGGADSTLLFYLLCGLNLEAYTFASPFQDEEEINFTKKICKKFNIPHKLIKINPLENEILKFNPKERCYVCKKMFLSEIKKLSFKRQVMDGTNFDDLSVFRPGIKALKELEIISPFAEFKITKKEIREYSKLIGVETYNKPSTPCFATRFPYGTKLSESLLNKAKEGERILKSFGFKVCRLRIHNDIARIEIPKEDFVNFLNKKEDLVRELKTPDLKYLTLDLEGFRTGSMD